MKVISILVLPLLSFAINTSLFAQTNGEKLFVEKCTSCHLLKFPDSRSKLKASPVTGMMFQLNQNIYSDEKLVSFIKDFVINPTQDKIVYDRTRKFGPMPSQKGKLTQEELDIVANWMVDNIYMTRKQLKAAKHRMKRSNAEVK